MWGGGGGHCSDLLCTEFCSESYDGPSDDGPSRVGCWLEYLQQNTCLLCNRSTVIWRVTAVMQHSQRHTVTVSGDCAVGHAIVHMHNTA